MKYIQDLYLEGDHPSKILEAMFAPKNRDLLFVNQTTGIPIHLPSKLYDMVYMDAPHDYSNQTYYGGLTYKTLNFEQ